jgi:hypothetical protein
MSKPLVDAIRLLAAAVEALAGTIRRGQYDRCPHCGEPLTPPLTPLMDWAEGDDE